MAGGHCSYYYGLHLVRHRLSQLLAEDQLPVNLDYELERILLLTDKVLDHGPHDAHETPDAAIVETPPW